MKIVADANVLFSAFIRSGLTRQIWMNEYVKLYSPEFLLEEYKSHATELKTKSGIGEEKNLRLAGDLLNKITFVEASELLPYAQAAHLLTTDEKDEAYVACALAIGADLWSRDRHLKNNRIKCWSTRELAEYFGYL